MGILPDIENGQLVPEQEPPKLFVAPKLYSKKNEEARLSELNNFGRKRMTEDFSDSPHLNK